MLSAWLDPHQRRYNIPVFETLSARPPHSSVQQLMVLLRRWQNAWRADFRDSALNDGSCFPLVPHCSGAKTVKTWHWNTWETPRWFVDDKPGCIYFFQSDFSFRWCVPFPDGDVPFPKKVTHSNTTSMQNCTEDLLAVNPPIPCPTSVGSRCFCSRTWLDYVLPVVLRGLPCGHWYWQWRMTMSLYDSLNIVYYICTAHW